MAWTQAELDALRSAYASGTTRVTYEGRTVEYDTGASLLDRIRVIEAGFAGPNRRRHGTTLAAFRKY